MLIRAFRLVLGRHRKRIGDEEGESDVKTFDIGHAGRARGIGRRHSLGATTGDAADECLSGLKGTAPKAQSLALSRRALDRTALLVYRRRRPEGALCVGADFAGDPASAWRSIRNSAEDSRAGARSAAPRAPLAVAETETVAELLLAVLVEPVPSGAEPPKIAAAEEPKVSRQPLMMPAGLPASGHRPTTRKSRITPTRRTRCRWYGRS